jgi:hypothetical protein
VCAWCRCPRPPPPPPDQHRVRSEQHSYLCWSERLSGQTDNFVSHPIFAYV